MDFFVQILPGLVGFIFTLLILSYVVGDNPGFRLAIHAFIGVSAGYVLAMVLVQVIVNQMIVPIGSGRSEEWVLEGIPLFFGIVLWAKIFPRTEWLGRPVVAFLVGTGAAAAVAGALLGTIYPQVLGSVNLFDQKNLTGDPLRVLEAALVLIGTVATLAYFQFTLLGKNSPGGKRGRFISILAWVGQIFIAITLGALFAGTFSAALTALVDRIQFIVLFIDQFLH
jgi:hypothetical protein